MKRTALFLYLIAVILSLTACSKVDLSGVESRLSKLESEYSQLSSAVNALQQAKNDGDYITAVTPVVENNVVVGYTIKFRKADPITIYNGTNGKDGADGKDGKDGKDGDIPNVTISYTDTSIVFTFSDGTVIEIPFSSSDFIKSIVSVTFVPEFYDGLPTMYYGKDSKHASLRYVISPSSVAGTLTKDKVKVNAVYTQTRASIDDIPLTVTAFSADAATGVVDLTIDGSALSNEYYSGKVFASISLQISDGSAAYNTDYLQIIAKSNGPDPTATMGSAEVSESSGRTSCSWVQLWKDGPKWAEFSVGATISDYGKPATSTKDNTSQDGFSTVYCTENVGGLYKWEKPGTNYRAFSSPINDGDVATVLWGSLWRTPSKSELNKLANYTDDGSAYLVSPVTKWEWMDGNTTKYVPDCPIAGWKVSGIASGYENNSIFLPAGGYYDNYMTSEMKRIGKVSYFWSSTPSDNQGIGAYYTLGEHACSYCIRDSYAYSVRAILK